MSKYHSMTLLLMAVEITKTTNRKCFMMFKNWEKIGKNMEYQIHLGQKCLGLLTDFHGVEANFFKIANSHNFFCLQCICILVTGKSLSEALILASVNPQYEERLFIELHEKHKFSHVGYNCLSKQ